MKKLSAAVAAFLLGIGLAGTSHAAPSPAVATAPSGSLAAEEFAAEEFEMTLLVTGSERTWSRAVVLTCPAARTGGHPDPAAACAELVEAGGDFDALPDDARVCTREFDPVTAWARGTYRSRPVSWSKTYANACLLASATGSVFRF